MGILAGGGVGQSLNQGQVGAVDPAAFAPVGQGTGPIATGQHNLAAQAVIPTAVAAGAQDQDQTGVQLGFGGDAVGGDVTTTASGNIGINND